MVADRTRFEAVKYINGLSDERSLIELLEFANPELWGKVISSLKRKYRTSSLLPNLLTDLT